MRKRVIFGQNKLNKPYKRVRCPFVLESIQIIGITEEQTNFVILLCPSAKCRTILEIIPQYYIGINK